MQSRHLIGGLGGIQHLIECHPVGGDACIVFGDDFLGRYVQHLFHHVHARPDAVDEGHQNIQTGFHASCIAAEPFHCVIETLGNLLQRKKQQDDQQNDERQNKQIKTEHEKIPNKSQTGPTGLFLRIAALAITWA